MTSEYSIPYRKIIDYLDTLIKSRFIEEFGSPISNNKNWPTRTLREVAPDKKCSFNPSGNDNWLLNLDAVQSNSGQVLFKKRVSKDELGGSVMAFTKDYVLYSKLRPYLNKVVLPDEDGFGTTELIPLLPDKTVLTREYLAYFLRSDPIVAKLSDSVSGTKMPRVSMNKFWEIRVPLPPIEIQKRFAEFVNLVEKTKVLAYKEISLVDELIKSRFNEMFDSVDISKQDQHWMRIDELGTVLTGTTPSTSVEENWGGDILWVTPAEIEEETIYIRNTERKLTLTGKNSCSMDLIKSGSVLFTSRAPVGKVAIAAADMYCNQGFKNVECGPLINNIYLYFILKNNTKYLNSIASGTTFPELSKKKFESIRIPVPPIQKQNEFAKFFTQINKSEFEPNRLDK
jgi:type I restriction enzyme S subunit